MTRQFGRVNSRGEFTHAVSDILSAKFSEKNVSSISPFQVEDKGQNLCQEVDPGPNWQAGPSWNPAKRSLLNARIRPF